jgi:hydrogenase expression/formation protein HypC
MCLGIPGKITQVFNQDGLLMGLVEFSGVQRETCLAAVPDAQPGDYVIVHAGFAISRMDEAEALETIRVLDEINELE